MEPTQPKPFFAPTSLYFPQDRPVFCSFDQTTHLNAAELNIDSQTPHDRRH